IGTISDTLNEVTVQTTTDEICADYYGSLTINGDQICIDASDGRGTCQGDSGGPLNYNTAGGWQTRGITSFGASAGCESGAPDAFTQVTHFLDWIESKTGVTNSK
ncbi:Chymotrypsin-like serine proteinase, partial [Armadillidium nasatum]